MSSIRIFVGLNGANGRAAGSCVISFRQGVNGKPPDSEVFARADFASFNPD
jgi:hypothetical protein